MTGPGMLVNSGQFDGLAWDEANRKMTDDANGAASVKGRCSTA